MQGLLPTTNHVVASAELGLGTGKKGCGIRYLLLTCLRRCVHSTCKFKLCRVAVFVSICECLLMLVLVSVKLGVCLTTTRIHPSYWCVCGCLWVFVSVCVVVIVY